MMELHILNVLFNFMTIVILLWILSRRNGRNSRKDNDFNF